MSYKTEINQSVGEEIQKKWMDLIVEQTLKTVKVNNAEISFAIVGEGEMRKLNKKWRGRDKVTDVLSFTYQRQNARYKIPLVGEIIICYPQAVKQARERGHGVKQEIKTLLVHGLLHLCGHDHEGNLKDAKKMEKLQNKLLNC